MRLKTSNVAKFGSDLLKNTYEGLTLQSHEILQTFVWYKVTVTLTRPLKTRLCEGLSSLALNVQ